VHVYRYAAKELEQTHAPDVGQRKLLLIRKDNLK
jgi:hypothetical protein